MNQDIICLMAAQENVDISTIIENNRLYTVFCVLPSRWKAVYTKQTYYRLSVSNTIKEE